jgi:hypothetical protein
MISKEVFMKLQNFIDELISLYGENKITKDTLDSMNLYASRLTDSDDLEEVLDDKIHIISRKEERRYLFDDKDHAQSIVTTKIKYRGNKYLIVTDDTTYNSFGIRYTRRLFSKEGGLLGETIINQVDRTGEERKGFRHDFALHEALLKKGLLSERDFEDKSYGEENNQ